MKTSQSFSIQLTLSFKTISYGISAIDIACLPIYTASTVNAPMVRHENERDPCPTHLCQAVCPVTSAQTAIMRQTDYRTNSSDGAGHLTATSQAGVLRLLAALRSGKLGEVGEERMLPRKRCAYWLLGNFATPAYDCCYQAGMCPSVFLCCTIVMRTD